MTADAGEMEKQRQPLPWELLSGREEPQLGAELTSVPCEAKADGMTRSS